MDSQRIGRALGITTRVFSKAVSHALEQTAEEKARQIKTAAAAVAEVAAQAANANAIPVAREVTQKAAAASRNAAATTKNTARKAGRFGEAIWGPIVHTSGVVWLEVMGVLFAFVALYFAQSLWRFRADIFLPPRDILFQHYMVYIASTGLFVYFAVSSFIRAEQKSRRKR